MFRDLIVKLLAKLVLRVVRRALDRRPGVELPAEEPETGPRPAPAARETQPAPDHDRTPEPDMDETPEDREDVTILVADDEDAVREILSVRFSREGFDLITAKNGNEALQKIRTENPDLVFLDWLMPYKNGIRVLREVRKARDTSSLPVFMMLDRGNSADKVKALSNGANDCVEKPINFDVALARIETQLDLVRQYERVKSLVQYDEETRLFNRPFLIERLDVEIERVERHGGELMVMIIGVHSEEETLADGTLPGIAEGLDDTLRQMDVLGRLDENHFGIILPETIAEHRSVVQDRIMEALSRESFTEKFQFTFGTSLTTTGEETAAQMFEAARADLSRYGDDRDQQAG